MWERERESGSFRAACGIVVEWWAAAEGHHSRNWCNHILTAPATRRKIFPSAPAGLRTGRLPSPLPPPSLCTKKRKAPREGTEDAQ